MDSIPSTLMSARLGTWNVHAIHYRGDEIGLVAASSNLTCIREGCVSACVCVCVVQALPSTS
jgi:hypothetical protein